MVEIVKAALKTVVSHRIEIEHGISLEDILKKVSLTSKMIIISYDSVRPSDFYEDGSHTLREHVYSLYIFDKDIDDTVDKLIKDLPRKYEYEGEQVSFRNEGGGFIRTKSGAVFELNLTLIKE